MNWFQQAGQQAKEISWHSLKQVMNKSRESDWVQDAVVDIFYEMVFLEWYRLVMRF